ncbi:ATP-binding cassette sub-family A member 2-like isoform X2 [Octopus vulgaris]|uniref:ATP-binding cassette sub-family A member 2 n=1 Tax=Octopus vulgaris TaxID=6645 RepID=A0AA36AL47_OCTVU|nr:ATP-binding cassette sub-family A member 2-like isoform X2 [Octopus vulgaris]
MGFLHQLRLLLWKNFTLKKRSPLVLLFEQFIPLVLFVILILIRRKQPAHPWKASFYAAKPLPSAGVVSIMQAFCDGGSWDENSFVTFPKNRVHEFLGEVQSVAKDNNFFVPGFSPTEMDEIPGIYKSIIDNPAALHDSFKNAKNFHLNSVLSNTNKLEHFLEQNMSLTSNEAESILDASVNVKKIYELLFGTSLDLPFKIREKRDVNTTEQNSLKALHANVLNNLNYEMMEHSAEDLIPKAEMFPEVSMIGQGLLYELLESPQLKLDESLLNVMRQLLGIPVSKSDKIDPYEVAEVLKMILLSPALVRKVACDYQNTSIILTPSSNSSITYLIDAQKKICKSNKEDLQKFVNLLKSDISDEEIVNILHLRNLNVTEAENQVKDFLTKVEKFYMFQMNLNELSMLASSLPQDACDQFLPAGTETSSSVPNNFTNLNMSDSHASTVLDPPGSATSNSAPSNTDSKTNNKDRYIGLLKIWTSMQKTICGHDTNIPKDKWEDDIRNMNLDDLGMSITQQHNIGILVHVLYSNPKVLYAPANTSADNVIRQANQTFALLDRISEYAEKWLNISEELRLYLSRNETAEHLDSIREIQQDLKRRKTLAMLLRTDSRIDKFLNISIPTPEFFLLQLSNIDNAACSWRAMLSGISLNVFQGFSDEQKLVDYVFNEAYHDNVSVFASVLFENIHPDGSLPPHIRYKIRQNASFTPTTKLVRSRYWYPGPGPTKQSYYQFGFVWIQDIIERAIIDTQVGHDVVEPGAYIHQFPYPCYVYDQFVFMIEHVMPLCLTISWVYTVAMLVQSIVYEKEQRLKEVMKMMGLNNAVHWCAWFTTTFIQMTITMAILTAMLKYGKVLTHSDPWVIFTVLEVFALATICFSFLVSVLYSKAKLAAACAGIVYFLTYVPYMYIAIKEEAAGDKVLAITKSIASLFSTTAFGLGAKYFAFYEEEGVGVHWDNISISPVENDDYNLALVTMMMLVDSLLYGLLVWYIENVHPGSFGLPKPWCFPFTQSYWCGTTGKPESNQCTWFTNLFKRSHISLSVTEEDQACAMEQRQSEYFQNFEPEPKHLPLGVCIDNLTKVYKTGKKVAVKNLTLNLYEGQITSFLGHNGAGKTTTMSILTGFFPPTSGYAMVYGHDIRTNMDVIRKDLGMCPQHNVLFDKLTVKEHLWFYGQLKGMKTEEIEREMEIMIQDIGLPRKKNCSVDCLSGGMQRKLSVAIAFVGGSRTVILDEPTAGVDPYARRAIWDLLVKYKNGRTILLSTHHMDEADILGDRIAIISDGQLKCCGSSLFLKNTFGEGYHIKMVKKESEETFDVSERLPDLKPRESFLTECQQSSVTNFIIKHVKSAYLKSESKRELHYILPFEEIKKGNAERLFQALESSLDTLEISSFGVMDTTLEEVFLKVTEAFHCPEENKPSDTLNTNSFIADYLSGSRNQENEISNNEPECTDTSSTSSLLDVSNTDQNPTDTAMHYDVEMNSMAGQPQQPKKQKSERKNVSTANKHGNYVKLEEEIDETNQNEFPDMQTEGCGSILLTGHWLHLNQFRAIIIKRFYYIRRNWKGLFSQILLPALFVCIAMTVALTAPGLDDLPPIELSPSQYFNLTQPEGNYIPYANQKTKQFNKSSDAGPDEIIRTFYYPSGVGATCVLKSPFNISFSGSDLHKNYKLLLKYFEDSCEKVFVHGLPLDNFVPPLPLSKNKDNQMKSNTSWPTQKEHYYPLCKCAADGSGFICSENGHKKPKSKTLVTSDIIQDISRTSPEKFFLYTTDEYRLHRYGGMSFGLVRSMVPKDFGNSAPALFRRLAVRNVAKVFFNPKGFHSTPVYLNTLNNAILRANLPKEKGNPAAYGITVTNHPMNHTNNKLSMDYILQGSDVLIAIFIIVAMSFVPASFVLFLVYERSIKAKHLQFVSGMDPFIYWLANYVWDMCNYVIPAFCCIGILLIFDIPSYVSPTNLPAVVSLFLLYGWSITPVMYPASFWFREPSTAYICLIVINLFVGITCIVCSFLLEIFSYDKDLKRIHLLLKNIFLLFPNYCLGRGLMDIAFNQYKNMFYFKTGQYHYMRSPFEWDLTTKNLTAMAGTGLFFFIITLLCEYRFFIKSRPSDVANKLPQDEDVDVASERKRILRGSACNDALCLKNLTKMYVTRKLGKHLAVDHLCLGVPTGECFGLLGVNGAGKTTTFKMLTGDIAPTNGDAELHRFSILKDLSKVRQNIGYCPQFDSLYDELSAREHLQFYARLRGIPPKDEAIVVNQALKKLALTEFADKASGTYSGGNKRKLSTAIALIGNPPVIFMDEPTTGMDPYSRRFLWNLIIDLVKSGRSVILTSHSMEECEALCTRLAIMVNGSFKCLGSTQHLKNKYGDGYTFVIRIRGPNYERNCVNVKHFIDKNFPNAKIKEQHINMLQYEIKSKTISLAYIFSKLEDAQRDFQIEDYSVSQNTLDNVFINFVKQQTEIVQELEDNDASSDSLNTSPTTNIVSGCAPNPEEILEGEPDDISTSFDRLGTRLSLLNIEMSTC